MNILQSAIAASLMLLAISCQPKAKKEASLTKAHNIESAKKSEPTSSPALVVQNEFLSEKEKNEDNGSGEKGAPEKQIPPQQHQSPVLDHQHNTDWNKKIVKNATLNIEVENYTKYNEAIHGITTRWEAYIASEQENSSEYKIENAMTIRIPVQFFDDAVNQISSQQGKVMIKQITAEDVTSEFLDTKARLEAKRIVRQRYLDMLRAAKNVGEILQIEREANDIQEEIEAAQGRVEYLNHTAAYSTIQLTFFQILNQSAIDQPSPGFGKRVLTALSDGLKWTSELLIVILTLWPMWIAIFLGVWMIRRLVYARAAAK